MENSKKVISKKEGTITITKDKVPNKKIKTIHPILNKDHKRLLLDGEEMPKSKIALAVLSMYVKKHPQITLAKLQEEFPNSLHPAGLIVPITTARRKNAKRRRYYMDTPLEIENKKLVVCSEFGTNNMTPFIEVAEKHGFKISRISNNTRTKVKAKAKAK